MSTDVSAQRPDVIAKDILIAAIQAGKLVYSAPTVKGQGENLAELYQALYEGIRKRPATTGDK